MPSGVDRGSHAALLEAERYRVGCSYGTHSDANSPIAASQRWPRKRILGQASIQSDVGRCKVQPTKCRPRKLGHHLIVQYPIAYASIHLKRWSVRSQLRALKKCIHPLRVDNGL